MLNTEERQRVAISTSHFISISLLPATLDVKNWEFTPGCVTKVKSWACKISYATFVLHALFKIWRLIYELLILQSTIPLHQVIIHLALAADAVVTMFWYYVLFIKYPDVYLGTMKTSLSGSLGQGNQSFTFKIRI